MNNAKPKKPIEITSKQLVERMQAEPDILLLDVREPYEFARVKLSDPRVVYAPLSELARKSLAAQNKEANLVIFCHHGSRSTQVAAWLAGQGWTHIQNLTGGIDAYAHEVDPKIGFY